MNSDRRVMEFFPRIDRREDLNAAAKRLRVGLERDGYGWWIAELRESEAFAGVLVLQDVPVDLPAAPAIEVGWPLVPEFWGKWVCNRRRAFAARFRFYATGEA